MGLSNYYPSSRLSQAGVCTSSTRPASPYEGQMIYETDTDEIRVWTGASWLSIPAYAFSKVSGAGTISSTGVLTINAVNWITPTYTSGWQDYNSGAYMGARYAKTADGLVSIVGMCARTGGGDPTVFTLPSGYRPSNRLLCITASSGGIARVDVLADGRVQVLGAQSGSINVGDWLSLAGISFFAA